MKILFLDIDGVLHGHSWWRRRTVEQRKYDEHSLVMGGIDPLIVPRLNRVTDETGAMLVISSTIRKRHRAIEFREHFANHGITGKVLGCTPVLGGLRGQEIATWLSDYRRAGRAVERFAIIDDGVDMEPHLDRLVKTEYDDGMLDVHAEKLIELLGTPL